LLGTYRTKNFMSFSNPNNTINEKQLFLEFQGGNHAVFDYFFDKYYQGLCVYAYRMLKSNSEAEDLVQDFFVRILENRAIISIETSVKSYFIRSVHNRCLDYLAHQKVKTTHEQFRLKMLSEEDLQEYPLLDSELTKQIERAVQNLPDGIRETFMLNRFENLSYQQIAKQENVSVKTIEYRISKALSILRKDLGDYLLLLLIVNRF
jgi:RNA polymerase sigma-70 factor (ECF subfamily)